MMELSVWEQGEQIGTVTAQQEGLFYIFICKISKHAEQLRRIYVISKWRVEYLGIPYPRREGAELQAPVKTVMAPDLSLRGAKRRGNLSRGLPRWTGHRRTCVLTDLTVAALPERHVRDNSTAGGRWCTAAPPDVSLCGARRRGALRAKREEVPLGCNLAVPGRITGKPRRIQGTK